MRQIELLRYAINLLDRLGISYAVVGSYASGAWGEPRMTRDIDILIELPGNKVDSLCSAFPESDYYVSRTAATEAVQRSGMFNVVHPSSGNKIDFIVAGNNDWQKSQIARRRKVMLEDRTAGYLAAPEDVILGKLLYYREGGSEKHLRDISGILAINGDQLDCGYLARCAASLDVTEIWQSLLKQIDDDQSE